MVILENIAFAFYFLCKLFHSYRARWRKESLSMLCLDLLASPNN